MENLASYLKRFANILSDKTREKEIFQECLIHDFNVDVTLEQIYLENKTLFLKGSSAIKNFVFINKKEILEACEKRGLLLTDLR